MHKKIYYNKLFPKLNGVILKNLQIDDESVSYITTPYEANKIASIIEDHSNKYKPNCEISIIDGTGGVGGDTIAFCGKFGNIISIEENIERSKLLSHNIQQYCFKNITIINGDSTLIIPKILDIDVIYIDPPWGGRDYKKKDKLLLNFGNYAIEDFVINCFTNDDIITKPLIFALKMPKNYDLQHFFDKLSHICDIYVYELDKFNVFILEQIKSIVPIPTLNPIHIIPNILESLDDIVAIPSVNTELDNIISN
jgi:16S rRNA G966 N2-methylase RsmD